LFKWQKDASADNLRKLRGGKKHGKKGKHDELEDEHDNSDEEGQSEDEEDEENDHEDEGDDKGSKHKYTLRAIMRTYPDTEVPDAFVYGYVTLRFNPDGSFLTKLNLNGLLPNCLNCGAHAHE
jgi:hypothetical protein